MAWTLSAGSRPTALIYSPDYDQFSYGDDHPFKVQRFRLAFELIAAYGLDKLPAVTVRQGQGVTAAELQTFHELAYLDRLREFSCSATPRADFLYGLGDGENP